jgi:hypothetical protein
MSMNQSSLSKPHRDIPDHLSERIGEIADILARGLMRLRTRQSSYLSGSSGDCSLDCPAHQSGHANPDISGEWHG